MFRMLGKKVELIRYKVTWQEDEQEMQEDCISEEHKNEVEQKLTTKNIVPFKLDQDQLPSLFVFTDKILVLLKHLLFVFIWTGDVLFWK